MLLSMTKNVLAVGSNRIVQTDGEEIDENIEFDESGVNEGIDENGEQERSKSIESNNIEDAGEENNNNNNTPTLSYQTHVQDKGWQTAVSEGKISGTEGESKRLEGIRISLNNSDSYTGTIQYRTHIQDIGWQNWVSDGEMSGTTGQSKRLEAIQIKLTGDLAENYDVYYRVHAQEYGWLDWAKNGENAGTAGYSYRLEAIQILSLIHI